jgi:hypothetical protein
VFVEGVNVATKHRRVQQTRRGAQEGGIIHEEVPIELSNVMPICPSCNEPTRVGAKNGDDKVRYCRKLRVGVLDPMTSTDTYVPRLKAATTTRSATQLKEQLGLDNVMQVPRFTKIVVNMGVGDAVATPRRSRARSAT